MVQASLTNTQDSDLYEKEEMLAVEGIDSKELYLSIGDHSHVHDHLEEPRLRDLPITLWNLPRLFVLSLIRGYQVTFSRVLPPDTCRFYPTCSHYGYQAIYKYGVIKGGIMATWRIMRCNPFNPGGFDPVP
jgi:uncharacterized protein